MNERRRIIIQTGANPDEPLPSPHFDSEARMTARPVVPLSEQETFQMNYGAYQPTGSKPFWKRRAMLVLIVVLAIGAGVAGGFAISMYRNRQAAKPAEPNPAAPAGESAIGSPTPEQAAKQQAPVTPQVPVETPSPREEKTQQNTVSDEPNGDNEMNPPVVRETKPQKTDDQAERELEAREEERERRREERRERRRREREDQTPDIPTRIDRAGREINSRIREIFEGKQP